MLPFLTSLTFLFAFTIIVLLIYGFVYYRDFSRSNVYRKKFPYAFLLIAICCFTFLLVNLHAPLKLQTVSNLDHHFIQHDGFSVKESIELGHSDTANVDGAAYNRFLLQRANETISIISSYSEEPFYAGVNGKYRLVSTHFPALSKPVSFIIDSLNVSITSKSEQEFSLDVNGQQFLVTRVVKKGLSAWNIFRDHEAFIISPYYTHEKLVSSLKQVLLLRNDVSKTEAGDACWFFSGKIFNVVARLTCGEQDLKAADLSFHSNIVFGNTIAWGIGFLDNNKNQFRVHEDDGGSFSLLNRFPISYPLTEERRTDWEPHTVNKFLVSGSNDMLDLPSVYREGFLFRLFDEASDIGFKPMLLQYQRAAENQPLHLSIQSLYNPSGATNVAEGKLLLPARAGNFNWIFSVKNTYNWEFAGSALPASTWQKLLFGALMFFVIMVLLQSWRSRADQLSWVWQLLSCITLVLLTTRFFLYWRYKTFPPYEGMDIASVQQLNSFWNFGIIILATVLLALLFGFGLLRELYSKISSLTRRAGSRNLPSASIASAVQRKLDGITQQRWYRKLGERTVFFTAWLSCLALAVGFAALQNFDTAICRHIAIALVFAYFLFVYISYRFSPLVRERGRSWWTMNTGSGIALLVSNPVRILLSISLLAAFAFIDIGFAIVFLNFLFFNEAFLCINYAVGGLSAGSNRNAMIFGIAGATYLLLFVANLLYAPYIFHGLLALPSSLYLAGYFLFAVFLAFVAVRLVNYRRKGFAIAVLALGLFAISALLLPKEKILDKAGMTRYRIDVQVMPADQAIRGAYEEGKTYEPVIRAAQNQWFINTFITDENNPGVQSPSFNLLPHAPQNKGAKYNAQATDLVTSRFLIAEHGKWSVLLYALLLLLPATMLASFYKLYPDFTNRVNKQYPAITTGFSILNYLLITALLVILAAMGKYIFFGQDLPFGSILSKQSILVPSVFIMLGVAIFSKLPQQYYANRRKLIPGALVFAGLFAVLVLVKPVFNSSKEFGVAGIAGDMDAYVDTRLQPVWDYFDTARSSRRLSIVKKDRLFSDSLKKLMDAQTYADDNRFFIQEAIAYSRSAFSQHVDANRILYLDLSGGSPRLAVNPNYFRVEPPPHLQQSWAGNVYGDTSIYVISLTGTNGEAMKQFRVDANTDFQGQELNSALTLSAYQSQGMTRKLYLVNNGTTAIDIRDIGGVRGLRSGDSILLTNPSRLRISGAGGEHTLVTEPDAFMKNLFVNGNRFYIYPLRNRFNWARNFAESISTDYTNKQLASKNVFVSFDYEIMDSLSHKIRMMMDNDTAYHAGAEYGICIADGNGRLVSMIDHIKTMDRPDPNDKASFNSVVRGENGNVSQALLRKQIGNINLLRLNPGPGSTLKPIVFSAIASQLNLNWDKFAAEGFTQPQNYYGGEKVAEYDFEKNNGRISKVTDYLKYSDNYYHSDVLLLGSYPKQDFAKLLSSSFATARPGSGFHWPYFSYGGSTYYLEDFKNWPGYDGGKASFGSSNSFVSIGLQNNYGIYTRSTPKSFERFPDEYDSLLFRNGWRKSGFVLPEYALFDQQAQGIDHRIPYDLFTTSFRGHVKGSSQVMIPPVKMVESFGKMVSQDRNYSLTLNPYAKSSSPTPFDVDPGIGYTSYLTLMKQQVFAGMKEAIYGGTAARLGALLKNGEPYYYYGKTGTTGDNELKTKSKLFSLIISSKDIADPAFNFRNNTFYTIYFTSQNGPAKQNEEFQAAVVRYLQSTTTFRKYMK